MGAIELLIQIFALRERFNGRDEWDLVSLELIGGPLDVLAVWLPVYQLQILYRDFRLVPGQIVDRDAFFIVRGLFSK
ncbi:hypothetical protein ACFQH8_21450 [Halomicroarcula sp. GCM10025710]